MPSRNTSKSPVEDTVQNLMAPQEFVSIRGEVRSVNERLAEHRGAPPVTSLLHLFFYLEGESEAKISLYKVVV
jgi:hypothetical protein